MKATVLKGARTHNLKAVDLTLHAGEVVAVTGLSGAGKSSLAFDTLYAEGQRRFIESFSPYARQFLERLERPPLDSLEPVPAGIAVDRRAPIKSSRSTLATMADLEAYFSALFTREALPLCPEHGQTAVFREPQSAAEEAIARHAERRSVLTYPVLARSVADYLEVRERLLAQGYRRVWNAGAVRDLDQVSPSQVLSPSGTLDVVVDRIRLKKDEARRLAQGIEAAWSAAAGTAHLVVEDGVDTLRRGWVCPECARALAPGRAGLFSYESALGACDSCRGFGRTLGIDFGKVIPDDRLSLGQGAIRPWSGSSTAWERRELKRFCDRHGIPFDRPWAELTEAQREEVLTGDGKFKRGSFPGVRRWFQWLETRTYKMHVRVLLARYRSYDLCASCQGKRLNPTALAYRVSALSLADWHALEVAEARGRLARLTTRTAQGELARRELVTRLGYLDSVGLGYLRLDRQARTLSGGEAQRVTLTAALGTSLHHALFVLDEPTTGLHPTDTSALNELIHELALRDNLVVVVDHDPAIVDGAHRVLELGPGAGAAGGSIVSDVRRPSGVCAPARGPNVTFKPSPRTPTGYLGVRDASQHNLRHVDVDIPLGVLCAFSGPSGSGKSTLLVDVVYRTLARALGVKDVEPAGARGAVNGAELLSRITLVDQSPLGRTSRGNAATYTKAWDALRAAFASEPLARARGLTSSHFSFNVPGGRCEACAGEGYETVEMQFLADVRLSCPVCRGCRFSETVLDIEHRGVNVARLLELPIDRVLEVLGDVAILRRRLGPLSELGLGYLGLGQPLSTLSGGEAQRLKLARALSEPHERELLILDEPTAGLHPSEVGRLVEALDKVVRAGGSVAVIDHDMDLLRRMDWLIDLGPGAGELGGQVVASGTPEAVARLSTRTALALRGEVRAGTLAVPRARSDPRHELLVRRAAEHNLKGVSVRIPHAALTVITGPSGSGKSSLAFDVIFAEGQRRFLETLTPYARQFLPTLPRPDVEAVEGVPPSVALEQRTARAGPQSTVATVTEVAHYLRLLYAKLGVAHCPNHGAPAERRSADELYLALRAQRDRFSLLAPVVRAKKGTHLDTFTAAARAGILEAWCDGQRVSTDRPPRLARAREHTIDLILGERLGAESLEPELLSRTLVWGQGRAKLRSSKRETLLSLFGSCPECDFAAPELDPRWFSFNTAQGRCSGCSGAGVVLADTAKARRSKRGRSRAPSGEPALETSTQCPDCHGSRLAPIPDAVKLLGIRYAELTSLSVARALAHVRGFHFDGDRERIAEPIRHELLRRLEFLEDVGLDYLTLDRSAPTLSGGEMQRLRLAAQLGSGLTGALYVLDEPTIGLHPRDTGRLLSNLRRLVALGSSVLVVEHDIDTIRAADHLVDLGPGGGALGGHVVAEGAPGDVLLNPASPTAQALSEPLKLRSALDVPRSHSWLVLSGVSEHNLKRVEARFPHARLTVVAGVSGSGKSTLVRKVVLPAVRAALGLATEPAGRFTRLEGLGQLRRAVAVDQSPIGRTSRSVPATFLGIWDPLRRLFAETPDAKVLGYSATRFSFNTPSGGRCPACEGQGVVSHEMSFLPDVVTPCASCEGRRFERETLEVRYLGHSIGDVLALTVEEAAALFTHHPKIAEPLKTLHDLGAGYLTLGQGSHTLSGGEAQRLKLSRELTAGQRHEPTLYVLDEPTTGLHLKDVERLTSVLSRLVLRGDSVLVIEHHPAVIASADWVIELGPDAGERGGEIVFAGSALALARAQTPTASVVREALGLPGKERSARIARGAYLEPRNVP